MATVVQMRCEAGRAMPSRAFAHWRPLGAVLVGLGCSTFWVGVLALAGRMVGYSLSMPAMVIAGLVTGLFAAAIVQMMPADDEAEEPSI